MSSMTRAESVKLVKENKYIQQILRLEPDFQHLLDLAVHLPRRYNRWQSHTALKNAGSEIVGWSAQQPELRTSAHHEAMCWAFDMLLPDETAESVYEQVWDALMNGASLNLVQTIAAMLPGEPDNDVTKEEGA
jgi:hypothetical protein